MGATPMHCVQNSLAQTYCCYTTLLTVCKIQHVVSLKKPCLWTSDAVVQVLVRIHSSSVNPVDTAVRSGAMPIKLPKVWQQSLLPKYTLRLSFGRIQYSPSAGWLLPTWLAVRKHSCLSNQPQSVLCTAAQGMCTDCDVTIHVLLLPAGCWW